MLIFLLSLFGIITGCWMVSLIDSALEAKTRSKTVYPAVKKKIFILSTSRSFRPATELWWRMKPGQMAGPVFWPGISELFIIASRLKLYQKLSGFVTETALDEMQEHLRRNPSLRLSLNVGDNEMNDCQFPNNWYQAAAALYSSSNRSNWRSLKVHDLNQV